MTKQAMIQVLNDMKFDIQVASSHISDGDKLSATLTLREAQLALSAVLNELEKYPADKEAK